MSLWLSLKCLREIGYGRCVRMHVTVGEAAFLIRPKSSGDLGFLILENETPVWLDDKSR